MVSLKKSIMAFGYLFQQVNHARAPATSTHLNAYSAIESMRIN